MLDEKTLEWLERRKNICTHCGVKKCVFTPSQRKVFGWCDLFEVKARGTKTRLVIEDFQDAAEFEARVAAYLAHGDTEEVPCAHGMKIFCPRPSFAGKACGYWCRLRTARLAVEAEMIAEGKGPWRKA